MGITVSFICPCHGLALLSILFFPSFEIICTSLKHMHLIPRGIHVWVVLLFLYGPNLQCLYLVAGMLN